MKIIANRLALFIFLLSILSCKNDANRSDKLIQHKESPEELEWLKDYKEATLLWGFIDEQGKEVIPQMYDDMRDFDSEGIALANFKGRWGYIDKNNKSVIPFQYLDAHPFSNGLALVQGFDKKYTYINKKGEKQFDCPGEVCQSFNQGIAIFTKGASKGTLDTSGKVVIEAKYDDVITLNNQLFIAKYGDLCGIINEKDEWLLKPQFDKIYAGKNKFIRAKKGNLYTFVEVGNFKISSDYYDYATDYVNGIAAVKKAEKYMLIDENRRQKYSSKDHIKPGGEGLWIEEEGGKFRFINADGKPLSDQWYEALYQFEEGLAGYQKGEYWGYLNDSGVEVIPAELPIIWSCKEGKIRFISQGGYGFLSKDYQLLITPKYVEARDFVNGLARVAN